jgi:hypothetical protein
MLVRLLEVEPFIESKGHCMYYEIQNTVNYAHRMHVCVIHGLQNEQKIISLYSTN